MSIALALAVLSPILGPVLWHWAVDVASSPDYGHVLPLSATLVALGIWRTRRHAIPTENEGVLWKATATLGALAGAVGFLASELTLQRIGAVMLLHAAVEGCGGPRARLWRGPILAHLFLVPWPYVLYFGLTARLQLWSSAAAAWTLQRLGVPLARDGNLIHLPGYDLEVVEACSGLRSLLTLTALAAVILVWRHRVPVGRKLSVLVLAIPLALGMNLLRLIGAGISARFVGPAAASGWMHDAEGVVTFFIGALVLSSVAGRAHEVRS